MEPNEPPGHVEHADVGSGTAPIPSRVWGRTSLRELRDRKLVQWTAAYLGGAWLLTEVLGFATQTYSLPKAILRATAVFLAVGTAAVLVVAWSHGDKGRQRVGKGEAVLLCAILVVALGAAFLASARREVAGGEPPAASNSPVQTVTPAQANSVAVLPFVNMSAEPGTDYFSDGMTEELINTLARVDGLKVAARSSAFQFKGAPSDAREVGKRLGVAFVIEGSVRKSADRLRISVQLVDAAGGHHVWSETYDRQLTDVFAVQEEIARAVVAALRVRLTAAGRLTAGQTESLEAYQAYLRGRFFLEQAGRRGSAEGARSLPASGRARPRLRPSLCRHRRRLPDPALAHLALYRGRLPSCQGGGGAGDSDR